MSGWTIASNLNSGPRCPERSSDVHLQLSSGARATSASRAIALASKRAEGACDGAYFRDRAGHRQHRRHWRVHDAGRVGRCGHDVASSSSASSPSARCCWVCCSASSPSACRTATAALYAYSRHEFGDFAGYLVGWCYWIQAWAGNAAIVSSWVFYVDALFNLKHPSGMENWGIALIGLWVPADREPRRRPPDGLVPERHRGAEVPPAAVRRRRRLVLRTLPQLRAASTPPVEASTAASGSPPAWRCSPSSASRRPRSPPSG